MGAPQRYPKGVTNVGPANPFSMLPMPDPTKLDAYFNDFDIYAAGDWTITTVEGGSGDATEALVAAGAGGQLLITNDNADNDSDQLQLTNRSFTLAAGKKAWFKSRFKVSDATQSDFVMGLCVVDTTLMGAVSGAGMTDGIFFSKDDGDAYLDVQCQKNATTGQTRAAAIATVVDGTFLTVAWYYDGISSLKYYVDDVHIGTLDASSSYLPDAALTVSFGIMNGEAVAKTMTVDYVFAAMER